jgi:hypothetical protein
MKDCLCKPPSRWVFFLARLRYYNGRRHRLWLQATLRCPQCMSRRPKHRFGCSRRPGRGERFYVGTG